MLITRGRYWGCNVACGNVRAQTQELRCFAILIELVSKSWRIHYNDAIMSAMASQITSLTIVYSSVYSKRRSKKTSKFRVTGLCAGNSPVTGEFPAQMASNAENVSIRWRHHDGSEHWANKTRTDDITATIQSLTTTFAYFREYIVVLR